MWLQVRVHVQGKGERGLRVLLMFERFTSTHRCGIRIREESHLDEALGCRLQVPFTAWRAARETLRVSYSSSTRAPPSCCLLVSGHQER